MFQALLCPSSGARDYDVDYHIGVACSSDTTPAYPHLTSQPTANQERNDQCGNQHHSRKLLMMGIVVPEIC